VDRIPLNRITLEYANSLKDGCVFPPVELQKLNGGRYLLKDGRHRYVAHKLVGYVTIRGRFVDEETH
jgi:hypothetical protein